jgi:photosystem II stability/assembly factor-like uncharacterized protein
MVRRLALCIALAAVPAVPSGAAANGRSPATSSITFRGDSDSEIVVGLTFGLIISHDGGKTWAWMCEDAIGYTGMYDPRYAFSPSGAVFASTFAGLKVMRDRCTFDPTPQGDTFVSTEIIASDRTVYFAASEVADPAHSKVGDFKIYQSTSDGVTTAPTAGQPAGPVAWWQSLEVAPSSPQRLYLTGYRYVPAPSGMGTLTEHLMFRTDNAGGSWLALPTADLAAKASSAIDIVGIAKDNPDHVYARVEHSDNAQADSIYRSVDKGAHWTLIDRKPEPIGAFAVRDNGDLIVGTAASGSEISHDDGASWTPLVDPPHMTCLVENAAHELWACTQNYGSISAPSDGAGVMRTADLVHWTKVVRYEELTDAVTCGSGTLQHDSCAAMWCAVCVQLGCTPSPSYSCPSATEAPAPRKAGCCDSGGGEGALALGLTVGTLLWRRPRSRPRT